MSSADDRIDEIVAHLNGSCTPLESELTEEEQDDMALLRAIDEQIMRCETCSWWFDTEEMNDEQECPDCAATK